MLTIQPTDMLTGVQLSGDYWDLDSLVTAIYELIGEEDHYLDFQGARSRIVGVCVDIRKATKGEKHIEFVGNGIHKELEKKNQMLAPKKNIYFAVDILMPEILFTAIALNDFITLYEENIDNSKWNFTVTAVRQFQAAVADLLETLIEPQHYHVFLELLHTKYPVFLRYATQYVDVLNLEYLQLTRDERKLHLAAYALRLLKEDESYLEMKHQLLGVANISKHEIHELEVNLKYPEHIEW